jgi:hypothetical protein
MTSENFTYWLIGYFEISGATHLSEAQTQVVKDHLDLVFQKVTPDRGYQPLDTKFTGISTQGLCGHPNIDELYKMSRPIKGNPKEETRYC